MERGREGLELFKATNKLIGEAPFNQGAFWECRAQDGRPNGLFTEHSVPLWRSGVKEVKVRYRGFLAPHVRITSG